MSAEPVMLARRAVGRVTRLARGWAEPRPIILMYHRVVDLAFDPQLLAVAPRHFRDHLDVIQRQFRPLSLADLVASLAERRFPRRGVVVTIDDGYADNLANARPLLERFSVPATVFVATGQLGAVGEFWWDELERLVLLPGALPARLRLTIGGRLRQWELGTASVYDEAAHERHRGWHVEQPVDPGPRQRLYRELYALLHPLPEHQKRATLHELADLAGVGWEGRDTHRALTHDELADLADGGLVEIGAHTVTHPPLAGLPDAEQRDEVAVSRRVLEQVLSRPVASFAYPHGSFAPVTVAAVRAAGFTRACTSEPELVRRDADPWRLPRVVPRDWDGDRFAGWLRDWTG